MGLKLLTAMGNPTLIWELVDFFNGGERFSYSSGAMAVRGGFSGRKVSRLCLLCTATAMEAGRELRPSLREEYPDMDVTLVPLECDDICCEADDACMKKVVYRAVEELSGPDLVIASAGRKTVTQRIIEAGLLYGCAGYLTITVPWEIERLKDEARFRTDTFNVIWTPSARFYQEKRQRLIRDGLGDTFRSIYLLPGMVIDRLRSQMIGRDPSRRESDLAWLERLPKADLHCHLGGCQDEELLREMADVLLDDMGVSAPERTELRRRMEERAGVPLAALTPEILRGLQDRDNGPVVHCLKNLAELISGDPAMQCRNAAVLLCSLEPDAIRALCRDGRVGPDGVVRWPGDDELAGGNRLDWYMACGDFGGSTLLQTPGALRLAVRRLMEAARDENVRCLEIRCSPENYTRAGLSITGAMDVLLDEAGRFCGRHPEMRVNFLVMATRHKARAAMCRQVAAAILYAERERTGPRVVGFDLAGQEQDHDPALFVDEFLPLHRNFMNITIHAGEMADEDKIWEAIYRLHARRIGHGLKLIDNRRMMDFVRDHQLAIEMCPSSNRQTNAFRLFCGGDGSGDLYPLKNYLEHGIRVTVNTDNRAISATTLSREYMEAARMTRGGLSRWDILRLVRNGFKAAFLPRDEKDALLKEIDREIFDLLLDELRG